MNTFINTTTFEYPLFEGDIRLLYPEILESQTGESFPIPLGFSTVVLTEPPQVDEITQATLEETPVQVDGIWYRTWAIKNRTQEEITEIETFLKNRNSISEALNTSGSEPNVIS